MPALLAISLKNSRIEYTIVEKFRSQKLYRVGTLTLVNTRYTFNTVPAKDHIQNAESIDAKYIWP